MVGVRVCRHDSDRLVVTDDTVFVIDYKSHRQASTDSIPQLVEDYRAQLECYKEAAARLWPAWRQMPADR